MDKHKDSRYAGRKRVLTRLGFDTYHEYLASDLWANLRRQILKRDDGKCRLCKRPARAVHHVDYTLQSMSGRDKGRLISICNGCHKRIEFDGDVKILDSLRIHQKTSKRVRHRHKLKCRCCGNARKEKSMGRNDICLPCYKKYRHSVHRRAAARSG